MTNIREQHTQSLISVFNDSVHSGEVLPMNCIKSSLSEAIKKIDIKLNLQLNAIIHHEYFKSLESSWLGLSSLLNKSLSSESIKLKIIHLTKSGLLNLSSDGSHTDSHLCNLIYKNEFDMPGGEPYSLLIGNYYFDHESKDINTLKYIGKISELALAPFISAASNTLLHLNKWSDIHKINQPSSVFQSSSHVQWNSLREENSSKFIFLTMPKYLGRNIYLSDKGLTKYSFKEDIQDNKEHPWINAAFAQAECIIQSYINHGWCTCIRGAENGGKVRSLPLTLDGNATESYFSDQEEHTLGSLGLIPLCHYKNSNYAVIFGCESLYKTNNSDNQNDQISSRLPYIMATARFAHYLKVIARDKVGSFMEAEELEVWLNRWISSYVNSNAKSKDTLKAKFPLAEAQVSVEAHPGKSGNYTAVVWLRPWLQLEELTASLRLVTELPSSKK